MTQVLRAALTDQPIFLAEHEELVSHRSAGAIVGFVGMIRDRDGGRGVLRLEYSAHPSAAQVLADLVAEVAEEGRSSNSWVSRSSGKAASQDPSGISGVCSVIADQRRPDQPCGVGGCKTCQNGFVADIAEGKARKTRYVDHGWPTTDPDDHAVSELVTDRTGALSPFGELTFPVPSDDLPYIHPVTVINR